MARAHPCPPFSLLLSASPTFFFSGNSEGCWSGFLRGGRWGMSRGRDILRQQVWLYEEPTGSAPELERREKERQRSRERKREAAERITPRKGVERRRPQRPGPRQVGGQSAGGRGGESAAPAERGRGGWGVSRARTALAPPPARATARAARRRCQSRASQPGSGGERSCYATAQRRPFAEKEAEPVPATASSEPPRAGGTGLSSRLAPTPTHLYPSVSV